MDRKAHFFALHSHAWLGKIYKRLTPAQVALCVAFLDLHKHSSKDVFALAVARWYMDKPKPAHLNEMTELMLCANSALPKGYQSVKSAIFDILAGVRRITFERLRFTLRAHYRIQLGRNDMWAAMDHLVLLKLVAHEHKGSVNYFALSPALVAKPEEAKMLKCPDCKRARCVWIPLKDPAKVSLARLKAVEAHNMNYIEMIFKGNQGSAAAEERMYASLSPYTDEIEKRTRIKPALVATNKETVMELLGATIREKREARGITRKDLAAKVNVTHDTIGFIERDRPDVFSEDLITRIGKELKLPVANLLKLRETHNEWARKTRADMKAKKAKGAKKPSFTPKQVKAAKVPVAAQATPAPKPVHKRRPKAAPVAEAAAEDNAG